MFAKAPPYVTPVFVLACCLQITSGTGTPRDDALAKN